MFRQKTALLDELKRKDVKLVKPELFFDCPEAPGPADVPPRVVSDVTRKGYEESGWTTFERHVASLISPSTQMFRIDVGVREKLFRGAFHCDYHQLCLDTMERSHGAPVEPAAFTRDVRANHFTNGADCYDVVVPRYKKTFLSFMEEATAIDYRGRSVSDGAFWDIMATFQTYGNRELSELIDFSFTELSVSLEELVTSAHGFNLRKLFLEGSSNLGGGLSNISKFQNLKELLIWGTKVQGRTEDMSKLQHLTYLSFGNIKVEGKTEDLPKLQHLTQLHFYNTKVE